jgi:DNA-binding NtrC family response regulator
MGSSRKKSVLNVGRKSDFPELRHSLLVDAGFEVLSPESLENATTLSAKRRFDAVVIGAWVSKLERNRLVELAKKKNGMARVIFYYNEKIEDAECADALLSAHGDHADLIRTLRHLFENAENEGRGRALGRMAMIAVWIGSGLLQVAAVVGLEY